jgi:hypothetical protein
MSPRWDSTPRQTDWLTDWLSVAMWLWLWLWQNATIRKAELSQSHTTSESSQSSLRSELKEYRGVQWSTEVWMSNRRRWQRVIQCFVNCCNQLYNGPIISIIKSKTRLINHANPGYVTIWKIIIMPVVLDGMKFDNVQYYRKTDLGC